jgi:hypothetical protein
MEKPPQFYSPPPFSETDLKHVDELERKKQVKRGNRLKRIVEKESELLRYLFPEEANNFEIAYEEIQERESSIFKGEKTTFSDSDSPAYGIFLKSKANPENKYLVTCWLRPDLDAKKETFEMLSNQSSADDIKKGMGKLKIKE